MKTVNCIRKSWVWAAAALQMGVVGYAADSVTTKVPPDPCHPAWIQFTGDEAANVVVWVFYRAEENVPTDFNLLEVLDWNDRDGNGVPDPWDYPFLMQGHDIFQGGLPFKVSLHQIDEVPVWFTTWADTVEFLDTHNWTITIEDLRGLSSLIKGSATLYHEELHPVNGTAKVGKHNFSAKGSLEDGRSFSFHSAGNYHYDQDGQIIKQNTSFSVEFK